MKSKVLIISYFNSWITHFGTELEIGNDIAIIGHDRVLSCGY